MPRLRAWFDVVGGHVPTWSASCGSPASPMYRLHAAARSRGKAVRRDGHRHPGELAMPLDTHHAALALQAHRLTWVKVFQHQGKLDGFPGEKRPVCLEEHATDTEVARDARALRQLYGHRHGDALDLPPFWPIQGSMHTHNL
jgi:hypothetical protein